MTDDRTPTPLKLGETVTMGPHGRVVWTVSGMTQGGLVSFTNADKTLRRHLSRRDLAAGKAQRTNGHPILAERPQS